MSKPQQTIKQAISYQGIGLHSGEPVNMVFKPAPENTGIVFIRTDIEGHPSVRAHIDNVTNTMRATTLENGEAKVFTVEHVMAAFSAMNIDNCYIEMDSPEPAVGDGSSAIFVGLIEEAGIQEQTAPRHVYKITRSHTIYDGDRFIVICHTMAIALHLHRLTVIRYLVRKIAILRFHQNTLKSILVLLELSDL